MEKFLDKWIKTPFESPTLKRKFFDFVFLAGFICSIIPGPFPQLATLASLGLLLCIAVCFFDENFYLFLAIFIYLRYRLLIGDTPVFRAYSYLVVIKFITEITKTKFKVSYFPAIFVIAMHSLLALARLDGAGGIRMGLNVIVDCVLAYAVVLKIISDDRLFRKFIFMFVMGGFASGIYGWTNSAFTKEINVSGAGAQKVSRNFGALSDSNFAGLFYTLCFVCSYTIKQISLPVRCFLLAISGIMLLQTASISALIMLIFLSILFIILKFRLKALPILLIVFVAVSIVIMIILSVPQLREIPSIAGLIIRINEKLSYIPRGRWDLLTTDRSDLWVAAMDMFDSKPLWGKLVGGSVITIMHIDQNLASMACHNSYIQSILNFGIVGTLLIYIPILIVFFTRILKHFTIKAGYDNEDIKILQIIFTFAFLAFGVSVDFFIDWPFMLLYFI